MGTVITKCDILILAAGQSSRLGSPKQLLDFGGISLVGRVAQTALDSGIGKVFVIVGANSGKIRSELKLPGLCLIENDGWSEGMASSIRVGLKAIEEADPEADGVMILVCDQPHLTSAVLNQLLQKQKESGLPMAASVYGEKMGTPAVFHRSVFPELMALKGDTGARKIFMAHGGQVARVAFDNGIVDIDTKEDYEKLIHNQ